MDDLITAVTDRFPDAAPELVKGHSLMFKMTKFAYRGAIRVYDDGQASIHRSFAHPDRPLLVECEGETPTPEQLATLSTVYLTLREHFTFTVASFDETLMPHSLMIMGKLEMPPTA